MNLTGSAGNRVYLRADYLGSIPLETQLPAGRHEFQVVGETEFFKTARVIQVSDDKQPVLIALTR